MTKEDTLLDCLEMVSHHFNAIEHAVRIIEGAVKRGEIDFPFFALNYLIKVCADQGKWECLNHTARRTPN